MRITGTTQDGEGLDRAGFRDAKPIGMGGRGQHRAMLILFRTGDVKLVVRRPLDRHDGADVGERGWAQRKAEWVHDGGRFADGSRSPHPLRVAARASISPPSLSGPIVARDHGRWALSSAVEHYLDMVGVRGSIPLAPTISFSLLSVASVGVWPAAGSVDIEIKCFLRRAAPPMSGLLRMWQSGSRSTS